MEWITKTYFQFRFLAFSIFSAFDFFVLKRETKNVIYCNAPLFIIAFYQCSKEPFSAAE